MPTGRPFPPVTLLLGALVASLLCVSAGIVHGSSSVVQTKVELTSSANPVVVGTPVSLSAVVEAVVEPATAPTGRIEFYDGTALLGVGDLVEVQGRMRASLQVPSLADGVHPITARYLGDDAHLDSQSQPLVQTVTSATN